MFVLDASMTMAWCFPDEGTPQTDAVLRRLEASRALAPTIWPLEVANALAIGERRGRRTEAQTRRLLEWLRSLPIDVEDGGAGQVWESTLHLARETGLTVYDASYLDLAMLRGLPLATIDARLAAAAVRLGLDVLP